jgi:uncharacterized protein YpiB (UPF0302 family)
LTKQTKLNIIVLTIKEQKGNNYMRTEQQILKEVDEALDARNKQLFLLLAREYKVICEVKSLRPENVLKQ